MNYSEYILQKKIQMYPGTFILRLQPKHATIPVFIPGQYVYLKNPFYLFNEEHPFSIASSPIEKTYVEFCIKVYGDWTTRIAQLQEKSILYISEPTGSFFWNETMKQIVFLLGGIGISPIMSMLRTFTKTKKNPSRITMFYGNRTPETVAYKKELEQLSHLLPLRIITIYSHLTATHPWQGYRGFITEDIIKKEISLSNMPTFFIVGPPIFINKMEDILAKLQVSKNNIKKEILTPFLSYSLPHSYPSLC